MKSLLLILILFLASSMPIAGPTGCDNSKTYKTYCSEFVKWECVYQAIAQVESGNNPGAVGSKGDGGVIQILPAGSGGYLDEANRLLKEERFADNDRFCPVKSREIWDIVMKFRNPERSVFKAIKLHNPKAGKWYEKRVMEAYNILLKQNNLLTINTDKNGQTIRKGI